METATLCLSCSINPAGSSSASSHFHCFSTSRLCSSAAHFYRQSPFSLKIGSSAFTTSHVRTIQSKQRSSSHASRQFDAAVSTAQETPETNSVKAEKDVEETPRLAEETAEESTLNIVNSVEAITVTDGKEESFTDSNDLTDLVVNLKKKFDSVEDKSKLFIYGGCVLAALWLSTTLIEVIDSVPLFPRLMELVGFGYTVWFVYRYLLFKGNRDELAVIIKELKQKITG
eukprot:TRINITY_DN11694_c0_g1_i1.p1 TRINITY_DN11694_c0_g1~~TRINITY_DN11694_c0_g1_i1.p1  ORF type:complete len:229 (-),score=45.91 TRINITY_DN11694_c0_g1_i1:273-959(-)